MQNGVSSTFITASDGLRLHARCYGSRTASAAPVICLPGLTRTAADFEALASALSHEKPFRRVIALDYRGRGLSDYDRNPANYALPVELADVLAVVTALDASPAIFVGTSRGGILTMLLAAVRPTAIVGAVLNDIGPVIEPQGLMRIKSYVGKLPQPRNFEEGAEILRRLFSGQFPKLEHERLARQRAPRVQGRKRPAGADLRREDRQHDERRRRRAAVPPLWLQFDALRAKPLMVIRGANSDLLTEKRSKPCARDASRWMCSKCQTRATRRSSRTRIQSGALWILCSAAIARFTSRTS